MSSRLATILGWVTLIAILAALWVLFGEDPSKHQGGRGEKLFPGLFEQIDKVTRIRIQAPDSNVTLVRGAHETVSGWTVEDRAHYRASAEQVNLLLRAFGRAERREPKTMNEDRFPDIGLGAAASRVILETSSGQALASLDVGQGRLRADDTAFAYVFKAGDSRAWLVSDVFPLDADPQSWLDKRFVGFASADIQAIRYSDVTLSRAVDGAAITLEGLAEGEVTKTDYFLERPFQTLKTLKFIDVIDVANPLAPPLADVEVTTFDGRKLHYRLFERGGDKWLQVRGDVSDVADTQQSSPPSNPFAGWLFKLSSSDAEVFEARRVDFLVSEDESTDPPS